MNGQDSFSVGIESAPSFLPIRLSSLIVTEDPLVGELIVDPDVGIVYYPSVDVPTFDSYSFEVEHALTGNPVLFSAVVTTGSTVLVYSYNDEDDKPTLGTTTADRFPAIGAPFTRPGLRPGSVIISTANVAGNDLGAIMGVDGREFKFKDDVSTIEELEEFLNRFPDNSVPSVVISGHGIEEGGIQISGMPPTRIEIDLESFPTSNLPAIINRILTDDGTLISLACSQGNEETNQDFWQDVANRIDHNVIISNGCVHFGPPSFWLPVPFWFGTSNWRLVRPEDGWQEPGDDQQQPAAGELVPSVDGDGVLMGGIATVLDNDPILNNLEEIEVTLAVEFDWYAPIESLLSR